MADPRPIGYWVELVDRLLDERFAAILEEHGVTPPQWRLLTVLSRTDAASADELDAALTPASRARRVDVGGPRDGAGAGTGETADEHLAELVESGWVAATNLAYALTERGRAATDRLTEVVAQLRQDVSDGIPADDVARAVAALERMAHNLGWVDHQDQSAPPS